MAEHLSEDLISEILCRLPIKCLVGLKLVCKTWNTLISNVCVPRISREPPTLSGFLFRVRRVRNPEKHFMGYVSYADGNADNFVESYSSLLPSEYSPCDVLDCCNGLILLTSKSVARYFVCNPAIKQSVALPNPPNQVKLHHAALVFDPTESSHYKVVRYSRSFFASSCLALDVFSFETTKWTRCELFVETPVVLGVPWIKRTVCLDGSLYKLTFSRQLLRLDLKKSVAAAIELPCKDKIDRFGFIGVSKGVLFYANSESDGSKILIWQFDHHGKASSFWILKHCICINGLMNNPSARTMCRWKWNRYSYRLKPYAIHPTSDIIFLGLPHVVFSYHLESHKLESVCISHPLAEEIICGQTFFYLYSTLFHNVE